jgi:hypothetical protein
MLKPPPEASVCSNRLPAVLTEDLRVTVGVPAGRDCGDIGADLMPAVETVAATSALFGLRPVLLPTVTNTVAEKVPNKRKVKQAVYAGA